MSTITFPTTPRGGARVTSALVTTTAQDQRPADLLHAVAAPPDSDSESRRLVRAAERHRERIVTGFTIGACSVAGVAALAFAELLLSVR